MARGRIAMRWDYIGGDWVAGKPLKIPVRICESDHDEGHYFSVQIDEPTRIYLTNTDINKLKVEVFKELAEFFEIVWEKYYLVRTSFCQAKEYSSGGQSDEKAARIHFSYSSVELGTRKNTGTKLHRFNDEKRWNNQGWPATKYREKESNFNGEPKYATSALIKATPENLEKLKAIQRSFAELSARLHEVLQQDQIELTLAKTNLFIGMNTPSDKELTFPQPGEDDADTD